MSFVSNFFSRSGNAAKARASFITLPSASSPTQTAKTTAIHMNYSIYHWRSHTDIRPSCNILLVHDWLSTNSSWSPLISAMRTIPQPEAEQQLMLQQPLTLICPDLPNHGKSPAMAIAATSKNECRSPDATPATLEHYASALLEFAQRVIPSGEIHVVGFGTGGAQIALLTAAALAPERFGSFAAVLGGGYDKSNNNNNNNNSMKMKPLLLDPALDAHDLSKTCGDLSSLHQVDDFLAQKLPSAKGMSDVMRFNTGTSHCGSTKWEEGVNLKGTPSLQARSSQVRWNSNVPVLRATPDFGVELDERVAAKLVAASQSNPLDKNLAHKSYVIYDSSSLSITSDPTVQLIRTVFPDPSILQVPGVVFEGLRVGARGPTKEDAENMIVPFLSLYQDHKDYAAMMQQQQQ